ncbi:Site-specific DNA-cytosine methylase [Variovorax sp. YR634]|nr:Site-specific DNA-cytosine methylase [Variovorax sp. YR634]
MNIVEIRHFHAFVGLGGGARGFNKANPRVGNLQAKFRCIGGIDVDAAAIRDFNRLANATGTVLDLFDRSQFEAFHGRPPPAGWAEATTADIHRAAGHERPHIVFLSAPCKGFSGLLSQTKSLTDKYQALNRLTLRGVFLMLEAWKNDPPELFVFENVPRIATRGRHLLDQITALLRSYGYAVAETTHDCGELGGLAQSRKRFLLVARHIEKVPPFLYEPEKKPLRAVGDVLGKMLMPGDLRAGPMHRIPALQWKTWVRLAFVEAGSDWRSLNKLAVENGHLRDYLIVPSTQEGTGAYGVNRWEDHSKLVAARAMVRSRWQIRVSNSTPLATASRPGMRPAVPLLGSRCHRMGSSRWPTHAAQPAHCSISNTACSTGPNRWAP